jgi:hypothetical protein
LDYAANVVAHWPTAHIQARFIANCGENRVDPDERLRDFLDEDVEPDEFWTKAEQNLLDRNVRLLFIADIIPPELQRIVEFLNDQMDKTEVLAIEIKQFVSQQGLKSLVPRVIGQTAKARDKKPGRRTKDKHDEESFFQAMVDNGSTKVDIETARRILDWCKSRFTKINWGDASFSPVLAYGDRLCNPISVYTSGKKIINATVRIRFLRLMNKNPPFDQKHKRMELLRLMNAIPGINLQEDSSDRFAHIPLARFGKSESLRQLEEVIEWILKEVMNDSNSIPN